MFDARLRSLIDAPLNAAGRVLARRGMSADAVSTVGILLGLAAAVAVAQGHHLAGLALIAANRLVDGLDGAVARATRITDFGGYLDVVGDFVFYVAVPLAFGLADPVNTAPALLLVASFALTGVSFAAFATAAAKRGLESSAQGRKSFFYVGGLTEGAETISVFVLMTVWPQHFPLIAVVFAGLCLITVAQRTYTAWRRFR